MNSLRDMVLVKVPERESEKKELISSQKGKLVIVRHEDMKPLMGNVLNLYDDHYYLYGLGGELAYATLSELMIDSSHSNNRTALNEGRINRIQA